MLFFLEGPACDSICEPGAILAAEWGVPMISYSCASSVMSNKRMYPTFARTVAPYTDVAPFVAAIMSLYDWTRIGIITSSEHVWQITANAISVSK